MPLFHITEKALVHFKYRVQAESIEDAIRILKEDEYFKGWYEYDFIDEENNTYEWKEVKSDKS